MVDSNSHIKSTLIRQYHTFQHQGRNRIIVDITIIPHSSVESGWPRQHEFKGCDQYRTWLKNIPWFDINKSIKKIKRFNYSQSFNEQDSDLVLCYQSGIWWNLCGHVPIFNSKLSKDVTTTLPFDECLCYLRTLINKNLTISISGSSECLELNEETLVFLSLSYS